MLAYVHVDVLVDVLLDVLEYVLALVSGASGASAGPFRTCKHFEPAASVLEYVHVPTVCMHFEHAGPSLPLLAYQSPLCLAACLEPSAGPAAATSNLQALYLYMYM